MIEVIAFTEAGGPLTKRIYLAPRSKCVRRRIERRAGSGDVPAQAGSVRVAVYGSHPRRSLDRGGVSMSPPLPTISDRKPRTSGPLRGFFSVYLPSGHVLHEVMLHERHGAWWLSFPSKPKLGADGVALRDERGKVAYGAPLIEFAGRQAKDRFTDQVLSALRRAQPEVFATERVA